MTQRIIGRTSAPKKTRPDHPDYYKLSDAYPDARNNFVDGLHADLRKLRGWCWRNHTHGRMSLNRAMGLIAPGRDMRTVKRRLDAIVLQGVAEIDGNALVLPGFYIDEADAQRGHERAEKRRTYLAQKQRELRARRQPSWQKGIAQVIDIAQEKQPYTHHKHIPGRICVQHLPKPVQTPLPVVAVERDLVSEQIAESLHVDVSRERVGLEANLSPLTSIGAMLPPGLAEVSDTDIEAVDDLPLQAPPQAQAPAIRPSTTMPAVAPARRSRRPAIPEVEQSMVKDDWDGWAKRMAEKTRNRPASPPVQIFESPKRSGPKDTARLTVKVMPQAATGLPGLGSCSRPQVASKPAPYDPGLPVTHAWIMREVCSKPQLAAFNPRIAIRDGLGINSVRMALETVMAAKTKLHSPCGALLKAAHRIQAGQWR